MFLLLRCCCHNVSLFLTKCSNFTLAEQSMGWLNKTFCDIFSVFRYILFSQEPKKYRASMKERKTKKKERERGREYKGKTELSILLCWRIQDLKVQLYLNCIWNSKVRPQMPNRKTSSGFTDRTTLKVFLSEKTRCPMRLYIKVSQRKCKI